MPKIATWGNLPVAVRKHLIDRMRDRSIRVEDLNKLRLWLESKPEVPDGDWFKDFVTFKLCSVGRIPEDLSRGWSSSEGSGGLREAGWAVADVMRLNASRQKQNA